MFFCFFSERSNSCFSEKNRISRLERRIQSSSFILFSILSEKKLDAKRKKIGTNKNFFFSFSPNFVVCCDLSRNLFEHFIQRLNCRFHSLLYTLLISLHWTDDDNRKRSQEWFLFELEWAELATNLNQKDQHWKNRVQKYISTGLLFTKKVNTKKLWLMSALFEWSNRYCNIVQLKLFVFEWCHQMKRMFSFVRFFVQI